LKDPLGLYAILPTCSGGPFGDVSGAVGDVCKRTHTAGTPCYEALSNVSAALGVDLPACFKKHCDGNTPITCDACNRNCAQSNPLPGVSGIITLGGGNEGCPFNKGLGHAETLFHETLHLCGFSAEPFDMVPQGAWFRYLESACYHWRDPNAPPPRSPR